MAVMSLMESEGNVEGKTFGYRGGGSVRQRGFFVLRQKSLY